MERSHCNFTISMLDGNLKMHSRAFLLWNCSTIYEITLYMQHLIVVLLQGFHDHITQPSCLIYIYIFQSYLCYFFPFLFYFYSLSLSTIRRLHTVWRWQRRTILHWTVVQWMTIVVLYISCLDNSGGHNILRINLCNSLPGWKGMVIHQWMNLGMNNMNIGLCAIVGLYSDVCNAWGKLQSPRCGL